MRTAVGVLLLVAGCDGAAAGLDMAAQADMTIFGELSCPAPIADVCDAGCLSQSMLEAACAGDMGGARPYVARQDCGTLTLVWFTRSIDAYGGYVYDSATGALVGVLDQALSGELVCVAGPADLVIGPCKAPVVLCAR